MIKTILKFKINSSLGQFKSFFLLISLLVATILIISTYDKFRSQQTKSLFNLIQNTYLNKTLVSISSSFEPRFEKFNFIVRSGDSLEGLIEEIKIDKDKKKNILKAILKEKKKLNLYENQKIIFEVDNLDKKITKITIPINKKKDLIITSAKENSYKFSEINKQLTFFIYNFKG